MLTEAQLFAVLWAANMGLEEARGEGMKQQTIEAACRGLEAMVRGMGMVPYRRSGAVLARRVAHESSGTHH